MLSYRVKIDPSNVQRDCLLTWAQKRSVAWNYHLGLNEHDKDLKDWRVSAYEGQKSFNALKNETFSWTYDYPKEIFERGILDCDLAIKSSVSTKRREAGTNTEYPKFKKKGRHLGGFYLKCVTALNRTHIQLGTKFPGPLRLQRSLRHGGRVVSGRFSVDKTGQWWVTLLIDAVTPERTHGESVVGIDMGLNPFVADSEGREFNLAIPYLKKKEDKKLRAASKKLSRRSKGSNRYNEARIALAKLYRHRANIRRNHAEQLSSFYSKNHAVVALEDLRVRNMIKCRPLAKAIGNAGWYQFRQAVERKVPTIAVPPHYTSQTCEKCGKIDARSRKSTLVFLCVHCGYEANAQTNAAIEIRTRGQRGLAQRLDVKPVSGNLLAAKRACKNVFAESLASVLRPTIQGVS